MIPGNANPLLLASAAAAAAAGDTGRSLRFNSGDSANLSRTPSSASNRKTWTWSGWYKPCVSGGNFRRLFGSEDTYLIHSGTGGSAAADTLYVNLRSGATNYAVSYAPVFRDFSAWYHIVWAVDTTQATAANRSKLYVNGVELTEAGGAGQTYPPQNHDTDVNSTNAHYISHSSGYVDAFMTHIYLIDGSQLDPTSFGAYDSNGVWQKADYSGTFGTNGFHLLDFANESTIGHDSSGNNNDFTASNFSTTAGSGNDVLLDFPANGDTANDSGAGGEVNGNYCTLNPLLSGSTHTLSNGNLDVSMSGASQHTTAGTIGVSSGKWYWEMTVNAVSINYYPGVGVDTNPVGTVQSGSTATGLMYLKSGAKFTSGNLSAYGASYAAGDVIGVALDMDGGTLTFYKNGSSQGQAFSGISGTVFPVVTGTLSATPGASFNFGQRAWAYSAPSNHKALCTTNLPTPTIADGSDYFDAVLYTGDGTSSKAITGLDFSPDLVWTKCRTVAHWHTLGDTVRGAGPTVASNTTNIEINDGLYSSFDSNGFTVAKYNTNESTNDANETFVSWCWDAGSSTVSNTDGSITSSVRANQTAGFSIVSYTGTGADATVGHGLNSAPKLIFFKNRDSSFSWTTYVSELGATKYLFLNTTATSGTFNHFQDTDPTSSVFYIEGTSAGSVSASGDKIIAYCFAPVAGHSQISSWEGNGSSDGTFVHTGFRPAFILYKNIDAAEQWHIRDAVRDPFNVTSKRLTPSTANVEDSGSDFNIDLLSNGFKLRSGQATQNASGNTYIYYAVAENPFQANGGLAR